MNSARFMNGSGKSWTHPPSDARRANMRAVSAKDTTPELKVRRLLHRMGFRFRLHRPDLPGTPDVVLPRHRSVVFVHGCFWHGHAGCRRSHRPTANAEYWRIKLDRNIARDAAHISALHAQGWKTLVIWECELRSEDRVRDALSSFLAR